VPGRGIKRGNEIGDALRDLIENENELNKARVKIDCALNISDVAGVRCL
jgi:hypothetical protein